MSAHFWYPSNRISPDGDNSFSQAEINDIVELVRESSFLDDESGLSIDQRMTEVFGGKAPEWSGFQIASGICCVNCGGTMTTDGESMGVVIQFEVAEDLESFVFSGMLIDGVEQPEGLILQFEEQFATNMWDNDDDFAEALLPDEYRYDPRARFAASGYSEWEENALWDDEDWPEDDEEDDDEDDCHCGHGHGHDHAHHHDHCGCGHHHDDEDEIILTPLDPDYDDDDSPLDWGDDAAERFWYGIDDE